MDPTNVETVAVEVRPFKHQVGGHTCVLQVGRSTLCKPYMEKEAWFYENVPEDLKLFIPKYLGKEFHRMEGTVSREGMCRCASERRCLYKGYIEKTYHNEYAFFKKFSKALELLTNITDAYLTLVVSVIALSLELGLHWKLISAHLKGFSF